MVGPGDIVLDGDPLPLRRGTAPRYRPISIVASYYYWELIYV